MYITPPLFIVFKLFCQELGVDFFRGVWDCFYRVLPALLLRVRDFQRRRILDGVEFCKAAGRCRAGLEFTERGFE